MSVIKTSYVYPQSAQTDQTAFNDDLKGTVDDLLPIQSGRDVRLQYKCKLDYSKDYSELAKDPVCCATFCSHLSTLKIWRATTVQCPHCEVLRTLKNLSKTSTLDAKQEKKLANKRRHQTIAGIQKRMFMSVKSAANQLDSTTVLVTLDFAKVAVVQRSFQILHTIIYCRGERNYLQGEPKEKNDAHFVYYVWKEKFLSAINQCFPFARNFPTEVLNISKPLR